MERNGESDKRSLSLIGDVGEIDDIKKYRGSKILEIASRIFGRKMPEILTPELAVDVFYAFYFPIPRLMEELASRVDMSDEKEALRLAVVSKLMSSTSLWRVKPYTVADNATSIVASASFIEKLARSLPNTMRSSGGSGEEDEERRGKGSRSDSGGKGDFDEEAVQEAVEKAMEAAERDARTAKGIKQLLSSLGVGNTSTLAFDDSADEILRLARETDIQRVLENVEGIKVATSRSKKEFRYSRGWIRGLEYGSDIERIHYSQLVLPDDYFLASLANSKLLLYEKVLPGSRGPIYVLLDKSGSMVGAKIDWARAVAVALFKKSVEENRRFYARFFDSIAHPPITLKPNTKPRGFLKLLSYLARVKAGGGTDISGAIRAAVNDIVHTPRGEEKVSDIILITDGEDRLNPDQLEATLKVADARLHSVVIQGHNPYLRKVSYRYMSVKRLERKEALKVVDFR